MKKINKKELSSIVGGDLNDQQGYCLIDGKLRPWPCNQRCPNRLIPLCPAPEE
ncbi:TPA: bacteriocin [Elizabethkingia anophelis]